MPKRKSLTNASPIAFRGNRLRSLRHLRQISADKVAHQTDLTTHHIYRLERNERPNVWGTTIAKLALVLGTSTDYLLGLTDDPTPPPRSRQSRSAKPAPTEEPTSDEGVESVP